ncbi:hypothetical protein AA15973_2630 [Komagataeibacter sucrofermentans DSM 15973]|nr:hypothetical protein AA15973_2630 [Komagataeibacter sucrofermentans DSM 15973]
MHQARALHAAHALEGGADDQHVIVTLPRLHAVVAHMHVVGVAGAVIVDGEFHRGEVFAYDAVDPSGPAGCVLFHWRLHDSGIIHCTASLLHEAWTGAHNGNDEEKEHPAPRL